MVNRTDGGKWGKLPLLKFAALTPCAVRLLRLVHSSQFRICTCDVTLSSQGLTLATVFNVFGNMFCCRDICIRVVVIKSVTWVCVELSSSSFLVVVDMKSFCHMVAKFDIGNGRTIAKIFSSDRDNL